MGAVMTGEVIGFVKTHGWMAAVAIVLIIGGYALGLGESFKSIFDLNASTASGARLGLLFLMLGFIFMIAALVNVDRNSRRSFADMRRAQVEYIRAVLERHRALKGPEDEQDITAVFVSAQRLRSKTEEIFDQKPEEIVARELSRSISVYCSEFLHVQEYLARRYAANFANPPVYAHALSESDRQNYISNLGRWRLKIDALMDGAEIATK